MIVRKGVKLMPRNVSEQEVKLRALSMLEKCCVDESRDW
jgi:hypothetical protein